MFTDAKRYSYRVEGIITVRRDGCRRAHYRRGFSGYTLLGEPLALEARPPFHSNKKKNINVDRYRRRFNSILTRVTDCRNYEPIKQDFLVNIACSK